ncbi:MAG: hypothetical protein P9L99_01510 [Candidatus Lernaella stagnicola]|nr:hypothetical protein [Candidatus Lernaella stagnicola]
MRTLSLAILCVLAAVALAAASPAGNDYWLAFGPFLTAGGHFQAEKDAATEAADGFMGGGLSIGHIENFSWLALFEGDYLPASSAGQIRGEATAGFSYLTLGGSISQTYGHRGILAGGPVVAFSYPFVSPEGPRTRAHLVGVFYRLDLPLTGEEDEFEIRHQAGVRFLFDTPGLAYIMSRPQKSWWMPK